MEDLGSLSIGEVGKELGRRWKDLPKEEKEKFEEKSKDNREKFEVEMGEYKARKKDENTGSEGESLINPQTGSSLLPPASSDHPLQKDNPEPDPISHGHRDPPPSNNPDPIPHEHPDPPPSDILKLENLGFAKQKGFSFHPALKTGEIAGGTRIKVTYFGTGQTEIIDASKWHKYSSCVEEKLCTKKLRKDPAFRNGLNQLKGLLSKLQTSKGEVTSSGITFSANSGERRLRKLNKDNLQHEEEENSRMMKEKIVVNDGSPHKYACRECSWTGKFLHKARGHARTCGTRRRINSKKPKQSKYQCSGEDCNLSFAYLSQLNKHYRYVWFLNESARPRLALARLH